MSLIVCDTVETRRYISSVRSSLCDIGRDFCDSLINSRKREEAVVTARSGAVRAEQSESESDCRGSLPPGSQGLSGSPLETTSAPEATGNNHSKHYETGAVEGESEFEVSSTHSLFRATRLAGGRANSVRAGTSLKSMRDIGKISPVSANKRTDTQLAEKIQ